jgi:DNA-binding response OmpR family regulator
VSIKILLLEDDQLLAETLVDLLEDEGFEVTHVPNGQIALNTVYENSFNLYLLDINVPLINGITLLKELRDSNDNTPAIFLTSHKEKKMLQSGFLSGCDDYIKKPFDNDELLLRIDAVLKRDLPKEIKSLGALSHDKVHKTIRYNNKALELSNKEYQLLLLLMSHANEIVTKELILEELWSINQSGSEGAIRVYINRIKQLLPDIKLENIRGLGYKLVS